jgi:SAM-dependent methyltransferase
MIDLNDCEYLNIGCGKTRFENTINMDIADNKYTKVDIVGSVLSIPFPNERFKGIIFSHVLEHLDQEDHRKAILEIKRVLKVGGTAYIEVPDLMLACKYFVENFQGRRDYWYMCIYGRNLYGTDVHRSGITIDYLTDLLFSSGFGHLKWPKCDPTSAGIVVFAEKLSENNNDS